MIAVISNLHGNFVALESSLKQIKQLNDKFKEEGREIKEIFVIGIFGYMPFAREVYSFLRDSEIRCIRGRFDHLIARWPEMDDEEKKEIPEIDRFIVEWNREKLNKEGRRWIRFEIPSFLTRKFGDNEVLFAYGNPFEPVSGEIMPDMPTSYYENFTAPFKSYEIIVVSSKKPFIAETRYGKIVGAGIAGYYTKSKPNFVLIDTRNLDVAFYEFEFDKGIVEKRIRDENLPEEILRILHHGI